ncbi:MAG: hypothetical protein SGJ24_15510 [Chloroflexota bacterium]|nr:hypothetical protein [Chloroflexota bacterium]
MTDPTRLNEYNLSEKPAIDLLERMGYSYIPGANLAGERASLREAVLLGQPGAAIWRRSKATSRKGSIRAVMMR